jgi:hypothetical protein
MGTHRILETRGTIGDGRNSGFQVLNLAVQFGARKIILVGYDMTLAGGTHWHGDHPKTLANPHAAIVAQWRDWLDAAATDLRRLRVEVLNVSSVSALTAYPRVSLEEALS